MNNYYILYIDSMVETFSEINSGEKIKFSLSSQENQEIFKNIKGGDFIFGYFKCNIDIIKMLFKVIRNDNNSDKIELKKVIDVERGIKIINKSILEELENNDFVEISKDEFKKIYINLVENQIPNKIKDFSYLYNIKNKEFAFETIDILEIHDLLTFENIDILLDKGKSNNLFGTSFPILKKLNNDNSKEEQLEESGGRRYYSEEIKINGEIYVVTNDWYYKSGNKKDTRTPYIEWIKQLILNDNTQDDYNEFDQIDLYDINVTAEKLEVPYNYLVFGAPGTGKSYFIKTLQEKYFNDNESYERVTFYPNYSYANFVGTYKPKMEENDIVYSFVPGPFIRIIEKAFKNPDKNYLLIIEEINRANPATVFGDTFQLLDRKNGRSEYCIETSEDLKLYFAKKFVPEFDEIDDENTKQSILKKFSKLYIPSNMYIWATMNSADQGVYPMDTAFKRRWDFKYIGINENSELVKNVNFMINDEKINWNNLRNAINEKLSEAPCRVNEDKLLGPYFISNEIMKMDQDNDCVIDNNKFIETFKSKVIMYIFEDVAKQRKSEIFSGCESTNRYSSICEEFDKIGINIFGEDIKNNI